MLQQLRRKIETLRGVIGLHDNPKFEIGLRKASVASVETLPGYLSLAFILTEDERFFRHTGLDFRSFLYRQYLMICGASAPGAGSTITQQLMKLAFLGQANPFRRKVKELIYAKTAERIFSKEEILNIYLSAARFGISHFGLGAAASHYFKTEPNKLTLISALFLAFSLRNPQLVEQELGAHKLSPQFLSFMRIKLFEVFFFYVSRFGLDSLYCFEQVGYQEMKQRAAGYHGRKTYRSYADEIYREVEWMVLDHLHELSIWLKSYEPLPAQAAG